MKFIARALRDARFAVLNRRLARAKEQMGRLDGLGRHAEAIVAAKAAVEIGRRLAQTQPIARNTLIAALHTRRLLSRGTADQKASL